MTAFCRLLLAGALVGAALLSTAEAHQVWILTRTADGKLEVTSGFGNGGQWDAHLAQNIAQTEYSLLKPEGPPVPLKLRTGDDRDNWFATVDAQAPVAVLGVCHYGVVTTKGPRPFDLYYYAKRMESRPSQWSAFDPQAALTVELLPEWKDGKLVVSVLAEGKPLPEAEIGIFRPNGEERELATADEQGRLVVPDLVPGDYYIYASQQIQTPGERDGQSFAFTYRIGTLALSFTEADLAGGQAQSAGRWPGFLAGASDDLRAESLPLTWSPDENIAWRAEVPGYGQSSPIVWDDTVFVTSVEGPMKDTYHVLAIGLKDGQIKWKHSQANSFPVKSTVYVSRAAPTPAVDDQRVYAYFESGDIVALGHDGQQGWSRSLGQEFGEPKNGHGLAASLAQDDERVFILVDDQGPSYLIALNKTTGETAWKTDRESRTSWSSPTLLTLGGRPFVVVSSAGSVDGYDPATGEKAWSLDSVGGNTAASPLRVGKDGLLVGASPGRDGENTEIANQSNMLLRIAEATSDSPEPQVAWRSRATTSFSSPFAHGDCVYWINRAGVLYCFDAASGKQHYAERLAEGAWATPFGVGNRVYIPGQYGITSVIAAGETFELRASNQLLSEDDREPRQEDIEAETDPQRRAAAGRFARPIQYGAAAVEGHLLIRTGPTLFCVRATKE